MTSGGACDAVGRVRAVGALLTGRGLRRDRLLPLLAGLALRLRFGRGRRRGFRPGRSAAEQPGEVASAELEGEGDDDPGEQGDVDGEIGTWYRTCWTVERRMIADQMKTKRWSARCSRQNRYASTPKPASNSTSPSWNVDQAAAIDQPRASWTVLVTSYWPKNAPKLPIRML